MSIALIAELPHQEHFVPKFLQNIIHKKIAKLVLNILERFIDWVCTWLYAPYNTLYENLQTRIHRFHDGTILYDQTREEVAAIQSNKLTIEGAMVSCLACGKVQVAFARQTDYIVIQDMIVDSEREGETSGPLEHCYRIIEQEKSNPKPLKKRWIVDARDESEHTVVPFGPASQDESKQGEEPFNKRKIRIRDYLLAIPEDLYSRRN